MSKTLGPMGPTVGYQDSPGVSKTPRNLADASQVFGGVPTMGRIDLNTNSSFQVDPGAPKGNEDGKTLLQALTGGEGLQFKSGNTNILQHAIYEEKVKENPNVAPSALADKNQGPLNDAKANIETAKNNISTTIREAQADVRAMSKELGFKAAELFPDTNMSEGNEAGMIMSAAVSAVPVPGAAGAGSLVTAFSSFTPVVEDMRSGYTNPREAKMAIIDALASRQHARENGLAPTVSSMQTGEGPKPHNYSENVDWIAFQKTMGQDGPQALTDLMSLDPDNPSRELVPEMAQLDFEENQVKFVQRTLDDAHEGRIYSLGELNLALKNNNMPEIVNQVGQQKLTAAVAEADSTSFIASLSGMKKPEGSDDFTRETRDAFAKLEVKVPEFLRNPNYNPSAPGAGMG